MLRVQGIHLRDFRNYNRLDLNIPERLTIFVGKNAVGKTNIVEAVQLLTAGQSFRRARSAEMIRAGLSASYINIDACDENRQLEIAMAIDGSTRKFTLNGKPKRVSDVRGLVPSVTFTPDDLNLIKGSPVTRRTMLDGLGVQLNKNYQLILRDFEKILQHKNRLLKDGTVEILPAVNEMYAKVAAQLQNYRYALFVKFVPKMREHYADIANGEKLEGFYEPSGQSVYGTEAQGLQRESSSCAINSQSLLDAIEAHTEAEISAKRALVGPTHDKISFTIAGMDAGKFASQGQQRSAVLSWKLAEADTIEEMLGTFPVLLLDDVMSELDEARRSALVQYLQSDAQAFITTANLEYFDSKMLENAHIVHLPLEKQK